MPVCHKCGKANAKDSLFCQECGARIHAQAAATPAPVPAPAPESPVCSRCNTVNEPGMGFCKMCGTRLGAANTEASPALPALHDPNATTRMETVPAQASASPSPTPTPADDPAHVTCPACKKSTPAGLDFCQHCGSRVAGELPAASRRDPAFQAAQTVRLERDDKLVQAVMTSATTPAREESRPANRSETRPDSRPAAPARGRLIVLRDGRDHETHGIGNEPFDIGRTEGQLVIAGDPFLAPRHARFSFANGAIKVRPLDGLNGVFVKLREPQDLAPGDVLLIGRQLLRIENVGADEREPPALMEHGVRLLGSPMKEAWARLRQLTSAGTTRDVLHLTGAEVTLGSRSSLALADDDQVAERHATLRRVGGRPRIEDLGSPAGTFLRIRGDRELRPGDLLRLGEQWLRFESAAQGSA